ncbi:c-type cytochrome [Pseudoflavitalea sp. G-6-1-2]|uniref:c-type cytochrome n=1 Tax=Pseudoflavitalea sp. G-6-1-2 TaxID=2728841 RepID=UPI00146A6515|nr:c-type cytochrome [Pseudoflavitalea sp. G-6-1-2]NML22263.1 c-type cytochrome [Pseudoflavitalea sp. G-6-1-2]
MRKSVLFCLLLAAVISGIAIGCNSAQTEETAAATTAISKDSLIRRGEYLVSVIGCDDCHSPKRMGPKGPELIPELRLSGFPEKGQLPPVEPAALNKGWVLMGPDLTATAGPWGITYASNITSDSTGIGGWKEEQFVKAMREGKSKGLDGARPIMPPMPWQNLSKLSDHDIKAMFAYLMSVKAVKNVVPQPVLNQPK